MSKDVHPLMPDGKLVPDDYDDTFDKDIMTTERTSKEISDLSGAIYEIAETLKTLHSHDMDLMLRVIAIEEKMH